VVVPVSRHPLSVIGFRLQDLIAALPFAGFAVLRVMLLPFTVLVLYLLFVAQSLALSKVKKTDKILTHFE
jgi:hypothetical protein